MLIKEIEIQNSQSILGFETTGGDNWEKWDRFLTIEDKQAYHIGNICGTCAFFFERMGGANQSVPVEELVGSLNSGIGKLDDGMIDRLKTIIPDGKYLVTLSQIQPQLSSPLSDQDYFSHEQVDLWGMDGFWGLPHNPKTEYYRLTSKILKEQRGFFEFLVPTFPHTWLKQERVEEYKSKISKANQPTVVSLSVLDVKQPADWNGDPKITSHWCLAHYLLDGHHKAYASAMSGRPITMISFIALDQGISTAEQVLWLIESKSEY
jgi:hypothetical protein